MFAHIRQSDRKEQTLKEHCRNVAELCRNADAAYGLPTLAYLIGLLHDMGKATLMFQNYLHGGKHQDHAATGAIYCWERWSRKNRLTAQLIALCINGHHKCLQDCLNDSGESPFLQEMNGDRKILNYYEAVRNFEQEVASAKELDDLFETASRELNGLFEDTSNESNEWKKQKFDAGLLTRMLLSILVDADRWDTACFEYDAESFEEKTTPDWKTMLAHFDAYREHHFSRASELDVIRAEISDFCAQKARGEQKIYTLEVPTGGGKTFTSLRFALIHADEHKLKRIFYIIPYNTILDQNAADIREALGDSASVLVQHSNVVEEDEEKDIIYRRLAERWDSEIVLSSLVQFLNALFRGKNSSARRLRQLTDAVIIFDEIQAIPIHCKVLFEKAVDFLIKYCRSTVVLCTATQPQLNFNQAQTKLIDDADTLYRSLKRVRYIPQTKPELYNQDAAEKLSGILEEGRSVLCIVNVKKTAWDIYEKTCLILKENDWNLLDLQAEMSDDELYRKAAECGERDILCVHLSTLMCPAHRMERLKAVKAWTKLKKPVLCISTALIEAGINVSFPIVVRSMAGLPSIIQAGGRCNRNCESDCGDVYIWNLIEEKKALKNLPDIQNGKEILGSLLDNALYRDNPDALGMPDAVNNYFRREKQYSDKQSRYPYERWNTTLVSILSDNKKCKQTAESKSEKNLRSISLMQSFHTAGDEFQVIPEKTTGILVPYGAGKDLIAELGGKKDMKELSALLRKSQMYAVNLYSNMKDRLEKENALVPIGDTGVLALREGWYEKNGGVKATTQELETMIL